MDIETIVGRVDSIYDSDDHISWPDPHLDTPPAAEEYSRLTRPRRFNIVIARAHAWITTLGTLPDISAESSAFDLDLTANHPHRVSHITSQRDGTSTLVIREYWETGTGASPRIEIGLGQPCIEIDRLPYCDCDACDSGSSNLLKDVDDLMAEILGGSVAFAGDDWFGWWSPGDGRVAGRSNHPTLKEIRHWGRAFANGDENNDSLPSNTRVVINASWLS